MRHTLAMCLVLGLGCSGATNGHDPTSEPAVTPPPLTGADPAGTSRPADRVTPPPAEAAPDPKSLQAELAELDPDEPASLPAAAKLVVKHLGTSKVTEAELKASIDGLLKLASSAAEGADRQAEADADLNAAACASTGRCDSGDVTAAAKAKLATLAKGGIRFLYAGEGTVIAAVDEQALAGLLSEILSAPAKAYLDALHWEAGRIDGQYDEDGFGGQPADVAAALAKWEALAKADATYAATANERASSVVRQYLTMCDRSEYTQPACIIDKKMRSSYAGFASTNPDSAYAEAVAKFLAEAKRRKYRLTEAQLDAAIAASLPSS